MLVRRIATVTICAPLASMAARVSAKSRYLPVPISSREWKLWPPMTSGSAFSMAFMAWFRWGRGQVAGLWALRRQAAMTCVMDSAAADRGDDFQTVAVLQGAEAILAARHDFAVAFHGNAPAGEAELAD